VDAWVTSLAAERTFSGVVLLARDGKPFFQKAWGLADRGLSVGNRTDTKFNVGCGRTSRLPSTRISRTCASKRASS
jgi:hypothetical protein